MKLIFITFLILYFVEAPAQHLPNHLIYLSGDLAFGNYFGVGLNLNYVLKNSYSASVGYNTGIKRPGNLPRDLRAGLFGIKPKDSYEDYHVLFGRVLKLNPDGRINILMGACYSTFSEPYNYNNINSNFLSKNYEYSFNEFSEYSFIFNPKIEFPLSKLHGISIGGFYMLSKNRRVISINLIAMLGVVR